MEIGVGEAKNVIKERDKRKRKKVLRKRMLRNTLTLGLKLELSLLFFCKQMCFQCHTLPLVAKMLATTDPTPKVQIIPIFKSPTSKKLTCWTDNYH